MSTKTRQLRWGLMVVLLGLLVGKFLLPWNIIGLAMILVIFWWWHWRHWSLIVLSMGIMATAYSAHYHLLKQGKVHQVDFAKQVIAIQGIVSNFPDQRLKDQRWQMQVQYFITIAEEKIIPQKKHKILVIAKESPLVRYGDQIMIKAKLSLPPRLQDFDYREYLARFGIVYLARTKEVTIQKNQQGGWPWFRWAAQGREKMSEALQAVLPIPHNIVSMGLLLGVKQELPIDVGSDFRRSGLQHLLVVSGTNVTILIIFISLLLRPLGPYVITGGIILAILWLVLLTGADTPVLRAAIMGGIVGVGATSGRIGEMRNILLLAAVLLGWWNPLLLWNDVGFWLSLAATMGIITGLPILYQCWWRWDNNYIRPWALIISASLAAQLSVGPWLAWNFGQVPMLGVVGNVLAEPLVPLIMLGSAIAICGAMLPWLGSKIIALPVFLLLEALLVLAHQLAKWPLWQTSQNIALIWGAMIIGIWCWAMFTDHYQKKYLWPWQQRFGAEKNDKK